MDRVTLPCPTMVDPLSPIHLTSVLCIVFGHGLAYHGLARLRRWASAQFQLGTHHCEAKVMI